MLKHIEKQVVIHISFAAYSCILVQFNCDVVLTSNETVQFYRNISCHFYYWKQIFTIRNNLIGIKKGNINFSNIFLTHKSLLTTTK